ncbi:amphi-Trp domain-containing protein [Natronococcus pandeyae]|uniref:Amphi-Trp domain-containing protein n=1 Tax=Natronococcus pandeyae TaxID=2055836 RepID=A0A8J8Q0A9_9EURY|nr:amphi-Trp domain-containing protein [Natronococcus pandeyae]TYL36048.1 amphi-Trp domain-containing protein [Natronococcus pandeyae]
MSEKTDHEESVSRDEAADLLQELAREVRGEGPADIHVGNKMLALNPSSVLEYGVEVEERSPMIGGDHEKITVTLKWEVEDEA